MKNMIILLLFIAVTAVRSNAQHIETVKNPKLPYQYLVHFPEGYKDNPNKKYPIILSLHGRSLSGTNIEMVKSYGVIYEILRGMKIDFIVVAPQCQNGWENAKLIQVLDYAESTYRVDKSRVYLTGMSMGGYGAWYLAGEHPTRFAAVAPVCGGGKVSDAQNLKNLPHWVHHGVKDIPVPFSESEKMVKAIRAAGNKNVEFSVYKDWGHSELVVVFSKKELYDWFLKYKRNDYIEPEPLLAKNEPKRESYPVKLETKTSTNSELKPKLTKPQPEPLPNSSKPVSEPQSKPQPQPQPKKENESEYLVFDEPRKSEASAAGSPSKSKGLERPSLVQRKPEPAAKAKPKNKLNQQLDKIKNWEGWDHLK